MQGLKSFEEVNELWKRDIGDFIMQFTQIEQVLHLVIEGNKTKTDIEFDIEKMTFENRIKLMKNILKDKLNDKKYLELEKLCSTIMRLKNTRNLIAHNGIAVTIEKNGKDEIRLGEFEITNLKNKKSINHKKLELDLNCLKKTIVKLGEVVVSGNKVIY
jgi:hypothetical protein